MPVRIQRRRTKGWTTPLCSCGCGQRAIYVGRPTKWGNPFVPVPIGGAPYRWTVVDDNGVDYREPPHGWMHRESAVLKAVNLYYADVKGKLAPYPPLSELCGHDLACWCPLDSPCHADVLLRLANQEID